jgi:hypothetical protein
MLIIHRSWPFMEFALAAAVLAGFKPHQGLRKTVSALLLSSSHVNSRLCQFSQLLVSCPFLFKSRLKDIRAFFVA